MDSVAQDFLHWAAFGQFVDQLVENADFTHQRIFQGFDPHPADEASDFDPCGVQAWCRSKEGLEIGASSEMRGKGIGAVSGQPENDLIDLLKAVTLALHFFDIERINARETGGVEAVLGHGQ